MSIRQAAVPSLRTFFCTSGPAFRKAAFCGARGRPSQHGRVAAWHCRCPQKSWQHSSSRRHSWPRRLDYGVLPAGSAVAQCLVVVAAPARSVEACVATPSLSPLPSAMDVSTSAASILFAFASYRTGPFTAHMGELPGFCPTLNKHALPLRVIRGDWETCVSSAVSSVCHPPTRLSLYRGSACPGERRRGLLVAVLVEAPARERGGGACSSLSSSLFSLDTSKHNHMSRLVSGALTPQLAMEDNGNLFRTTNMMVLPQHSCTRSSSGF